MTRYILFKENLLKVRGSHPFIIQTRLTKVHVIQKFMSNPVRLTDGKFKEIYTDKEFRNEVASAHRSCSADGILKYLVANSYPTKYIVNPLDITTAKELRDKAEKDFLKENKHKLVFAGMGGEIDAPIANVRFRSYIQHLDKTVTYIELTKWANEQKYSIQYKLGGCASYQSDQITTGKIHKILERVNELCNTSFTEIVIENYDIQTVDSKSPLCFVPQPKEKLNYIVINGKDVRNIAAVDMEQAVIWAQNHCDCSKELLVREIN